MRAGILPSPHLFMLLIGLLLSFCVGWRTHTSTSPRTPTLLKMRPRTSTNYRLRDLRAAVEVYGHVHTAMTSMPQMLVTDEGYSPASLYATLSLYVLSLPGLWSLVKRSVQSKPVEKVFELPGPANPTAKPIKQTAAEIVAFFQANNYAISDASEEIVFKGLMGRSRSQALFLTFCTFIGLGSVGLVLSTLYPDIGSKWYLLALLSPYAGIYYWKNAQGESTVRVRLVTSDDDTQTDVLCIGGKEDLERFAKTLNYVEKGKVRVRGLLED